jgi:hypothetical protein
MKCETIQRRLLKAESPTRLPAEMQAHLTTCAVCREWQRQLVQLEEYVGRLPVPASTAKAELLKLLSSRAAGIAAPAPPVVRSWSWRLPAGLAAAVLLLAVGGWLLSLMRPAAPRPDHPTVAARPPLLDNLLERDLRLANATTQRQRVEALADVADDLQEETRALALDASGDDLESLARLYGQVVREGIIAGAQTLPRAERRAVLSSIAERLVKTRAAATRLAKEVTSDSARSLQAIAAAAEEGDRDLRAIFREDLP